MAYIDKNGVVLVRTNTKYRGWCSHCNDWKLFVYDEEIWIEPDDTHNTLADLGIVRRCETCGNVYQSTKLKDIPDEKILEQQQRYKSYERMWIKGSTMESDAGLLAYRQWKREQYEAWEKKRDELKEEKQVLYKGVQRNEKCPCGSGLKYKKCCELKFKQYNI
jgi:hypothetical protein